MSLKNVAVETLEILENGAFINSAGETINFASQQSAAVENTKLYTPEQLIALIAHQSACGDSGLLIEVTDETTQIAVHRLVHLQGCNDLVLLNFASARNPGGGFISGAKAQEEDVSRCSGLYPCLLTQPTYYEVNRKQKSLLYTDHIIYSPQVPFFRTASRNLLDYYFLSSTITAPAPNAGEFLRRNPGGKKELEETFRRRAKMVLSIAQDNGHRSLLLGAWGCGVFRNDPHFVADVFATWLESPEFQGCFEHVIFAVYDPSKTKNTFRAFQAQFK